MHVWLGKMTVAPSRAVLSILPKLNLTKNAKQPNKQLEFWNQSHAQQREEWHYLIKDTCVIIKCLSQCLHDTEDSYLKNIWSSVSWQLSSKEEEVFMRKQYNFYENKLCRSLPIFEKSYKKEDL